LPVGDRFKKIEIMNLENLNLVELNAQEVQEVEGGRSWFTGILGFADGIEGNGAGYFLGWRLW
jgi:hypothetical protein